MGLIKKDGYNVKGIELSVAYAKINRLYIERGNLARTYFGISTSRENINDGNSLVELEFPCYVDKNEPIYEQVYVLAKENLFYGWEDDIVVDESVEEETDTPTILPAEDPIEIPVPTESEQEENNIDTMSVEEKIMEVPTEEETNETKDETENSNDKYFETNEE